MGIYRYIICGIYIWSWCVYIYIYVRVGAYVYIKYLILMIQQLLIGILGAINTPWFETNRMMIKPIRWFKYHREMISDIGIYLQRDGGYDGDMNQSQWEIQLVWIWLSLSIGLPKNGTLAKKPQKALWRDIGGFNSHVGTPKFTYHLRMIFPTHLYISILILGMVYSWEYCISHVTVQWNVIISHVTLKYTISILILELATDCSNIQGIKRD